MDEFCFYRLPLIFHIDSPGHLTDKNRSEFIDSLAFVDAEEVDLSHFHLLPIGYTINWDSCDGPNQLLFLVSNSNKPLGLIVGRSEGPTEELSAIVKPESVIIVLNIVVCQQNIKLE